MRLYPGLTLLNGRVSDFSRMNYWDRFLVAMNSVALNGVTAVILNLQVVHVTLVLPGQSSSRSHFAVRPDIHVNTTCLAALIVQLHALAQPPTKIH